MRFVCSAASSSSGAQAGKPVAAVEVDLPTASDELAALRTSCGGVK